MKTASINNDPGTSEWTAQAWSSGQTDRVNEAGADPEKSERGGLYPYNHDCTILLEKRSVTNNVFFKSKEKGGGGGAAPSALPLNPPMGKVEHVESHLQEPFDI